MPSTQPLTVQFPNEVCIAKVAFGRNSDQHFPATVRRVGNDLQVFVIPVNYQALEVSKVGSHTDSLLALAATSAVAPQFTLALEAGIGETNCSTKKETVSGIRADHGTPLVVLFDSLQGKNDTLSVTQHAVATPLTLKTATHAHGLRSTDAHRIAQASTTSEIAAGIKVFSKMRSELPAHALYVTTTVDERTRSRRVVSIQEALAYEGLAGRDLSLLAATLAMTANVVGNNDHEKRVDRLFHQTSGDTPLVELI